MRDDAPRVTVLMVVYNGGRYVADAIRGILDQDFTNFEFLVIDDGSTDDTQNFVKSLRDSRLRVVSTTS